MSATSYKLQVTSSKNVLRIVFFGTSSFAVPALQMLKKQSWAEIVAVVSTPSKPVGRRQEIVSSPITKETKKLGLLVLEPEKLKSPEWLETFSKLNPDLVVLASYGKIVPQSVLDIPKHGFINIHPSLLPKYRGASPIEGTILGGDKKTGVTIMKMDAQMDHGPILSQTEIELHGDERARELEAKLAQIGAELLIKTIPSYIHGEIMPQEQEHDKATFTKLIKREDGFIDLEMPPEEIYRHYRAYDPWPGVWTTIRIKNQELRIKILDIELVDEKIKINKLQPEGKKPMTMEEFERGYGKIF